MSTTRKFPVLEAYSKLRREISRIGAVRLKAADLGLKQVLVLTRLLESPTTMSELSVHAQSDKASTTRTIGALERAGLVRRHNDPSDLRKCVISLTAKGKEKAKQAQEVRFFIGAHLEETLKPSERQQLAQLLLKVAQSLAQKRES